MSMCVPMCCPKDAQNPGNQLLIATPQESWRYKKASVIVDNLLWEKQSVVHGVFHLILSRKVLVKVN